MINPDTEPLSPTGLRASHPTQALHPEPFRFQPETIRNPTVTEAAATTKTHGLVQLPEMGLPPAESNKAIEISS